MQQYKSNKKQLSCGSRIVLFVAFLSLIILAGIIFIFDSSGILPLGNNLSKALEALFVVLAAIFALGQWILPLTPFQSKKQASNNTSILPSNIDNITTSILPSHNMIKLPKDHPIKNKLENSRDIQYGYNGAIIIYTQENLFRAPITLHANQNNIWSSDLKIATAYVDREIVRFHTLYFAVFPCLPEGNYRIDNTLPFFPLSGQNITVYKHEIIEIDGRN